MKNIFYLIFLMNVFRAMENNNFMLKDDDDYNNNSSEQNKTATFSSKSKSQPKNLRGNDLLNFTQNSVKFFPKRENSVKGILNGFLMQNPSQVDILFQKSQNNSLINCVAKSESLQTKPNILLNNVEQSKISQINQKNSLGDDLKYGVLLLQEEKNSIINKANQNIKVEKPLSIVAQLIKNEEIKIRHDGVVLPNGMQYIFFKKKVRVVKTNKMIIYYIEDVCEKEQNKGWQNYDINKYLEYCRLDLNSVSNNMYFPLQVEEVDGGVVYMITYLHPIQSSDGYGKIYDIMMHMNQIYFLGCDYNLSQEISNKPSGLVCIKQVYSDKHWERFQEAYALKKLKEKEEACVLKKQNQENYELDQCMEKINREIERLEKNKENAVYLSDKSDNITVINNKNFFLYGSCIFEITTYVAPNYFKTSDGVAIFNGPSDASNFFMNDCKKVISMFKSPDIKCILIALDTLHKKIMTECKFFAQSSYVQYFDDFKEVLFDIIMKNKNVMHIIQNEHKWLNVNTIIHLNLLKYLKGYYLECKNPNSYYSAHYKAERTLDFKGYFEQNKKSEKKTESEENIESEKNTQCLTKNNYIDDFDSLTCYYNYYWLKFMEEKSLNMLDLIAELKKKFEFVSYLHIFFADLMDNVQKDYYQKIILFLHDIAKLCTDRAGFYKFTNMYEIRAKIRPWWFVDYIKKEIFPSVESIIINLNNNALNNEQKERIIRHFIDNEKPRHIAVIKNIENY